MDDKITACFATLKKVSYTLMDRMLRDTKAAVFPLKFSYIKAIAAFNEDRSYSIKELAENGMIKVPNMSTMIDELIREGYVKKRKDPHDRRRAVVTLTAKGKKLRDAFFANRRMVADAIFARLDDAQRQELLLGLETVCRILDDVVA